MWTLAGRHATMLKQCGFRPTTCNQRETHAMTEKERLMDFFSRQDMARAVELRVHGISSVAVARAVESGDIMRVGRGLYQPPYVDPELHIDFAEVAKRQPNGVICLISALEFHGLTDQIPPKVWMAIGAKDWAPKIDYPPVRVVRFREPYFSSGVETTVINGVTVRIYSITKSLADAFRNPKLLDRSVAVESLKSVLRERRVSPGAIHSDVCKYGAGKVMYPYLDALLSNG